MGISFVLDHNMAREEITTKLVDEEAATRPKAFILKRRNSPENPKAEVALYDVNINCFQKMKRRDAES